ncbi:ABC transporter permease subunit [Desulfosporosinus sp. PR]|nr:ABC transporter permease subunit [Desulfosporosinus sp. PR]
MRADIFTKRRNNHLLFFFSLAILTVVSALITQYDVLKGFSSIAKALIWGAGNFYPDLKSLRIVPDVLPKLWETVLMSIAATMVASVLALALALAGSRRTRISSFCSFLSRGLASLFRNIPLVAWAMVLMIAFSQSSLTGYLALLFGSLGFLTRAFMETIDEVSNNSIEALQATGAGYCHIIFQAVLPASLPQMVSWLLFMIETNIRDATLVGVLTGTGIGFSFDLYYKRFDYHAASLVVVFIVITVILIEVISNKIRRVIL